jgi:hypothetical protein
MIALQRISEVPTIPELMQAEFNAWAGPIRQAALTAAWYRPRLSLQILARLAAAYALLGAARLLLRLGVIQPSLAAGAFPLAARLCDGAVAHRAGFQRRS